MIWIADSATERNWFVMKLPLSVPVLLPVVLSFFVVGSSCAMAQSATAPDNIPLDVEQLFASTCGWCHSDGGRVAGKGPQLMDTKRDDEFIRDRIKNGKSGV